MLPKNTFRTSKIAFFLKYVASEYRHTKPRWYSSVVTYNLLGWPLLAQLEMTLKPGANSTDPAGYNDLLQDEGHLTTVKPLI